MQEAQGALDLAMGPPALGDVADMAEDRRRAAAERIAHGDEGRLVVPRAAAALDRLEVADRLAEGDAFAIAGRDRLRDLLRQAFLRRPAIGLLRPEAEETAEGRIQAVVDEMRPFRDGHDEESVRRMFPIIPE